MILLTAKGEAADRVIGLRLGADDYVVKPFSPAELVARVDAVLRRVDPAPELEEPLVFDDLELDPVARRVTVRGQEAQLTVREYDLLLHFMRHPGQVFSRDQLMDLVWQYSFYSDTSTVTVHVRRLRAKVEEDPSNPRWLADGLGRGLPVPAVSALRGFALLALAAAAGGLVVGAVYAPKDGLSHGPLRRCLRCARRSGRARAGEPTPRGGPAPTPVHDGDRPHGQPGDPRVGGAVALLMLVSDHDLLVTGLLLVFAVRSLPTQPQSSRAAFSTTSSAARRPARRRRRPARRAHPNGGA